MRQLESSFAVGDVVRRFVCGVCAAVCALTMSVAPGQVAAAYAEGLGTQGTLAAQATTLELRQTAATNTSVTVGWDAQSGLAKQMVQYTAYVNGATVASADYFEIDADATSYTISGLQKDAVLTVTVRGFTQADAETYDYETTGTLSDVKTKSSAVGTLSYYQPFDQGYYSTYNLSVSFTPSSQANADGYQAVLYTKAGKKVETLTVSEYSTRATFSKAKLTRCYKVRIRPYVVLANTSTKVYGAWSSYLKAVPGAKMKSLSSKSVTKSKIKVQWSKVTGASKYIVYVARSKGYTSSASNLSFKKVATLTKAKSSYTIKKVGSKKVNTKNYYYYVRIVTVAKYGSKTVKSKNVSALYCHKY